MSKAAGSLYNLLAEQKYRKDTGYIDRMRGNEFYAQGELQCALECYDRAIETYPADPAAYSNRALVNLKLGNHDAVIADTDKALRCDENFVKAYYRRGKAYMEKGQYELAMEDFEQCVVREPNN